MQHKTIELRLHAALGLPAAGTVVVVEVHLGGGTKWTTAPAASHGSTAYLGSWAAVQLAAAQLGLRVHDQSASGLAQCSSGTVSAHGVLPLPALAPGGGAAAPQADPHGWHHVTLQLQDGKTGRLAHAVESALEGAARAGDEWEARQRPGGPDGGGGDDAELNAAVEAALLARRRGWHGSQPGDAASAVQEQQQQAHEQPPGRDAAAAARDGGGGGREAAIEMAVAAHVVGSIGEPAESGQQAGVQPPPPPAASQQQQQRQHAPEHSASAPPLRAAAVSLKLSYRVLQHPASSLLHREQAAGAGASLAAARSLRASRTFIRLLSWQRPVERTAGAAAAADEERGEAGLGAGPRDEHVGVWRQRWEQRRGGQPLADAVQQGLTLELPLVPLPLHLHSYGHGAFMGAALSMLGDPGWQATLHREDPGAFASAKRVAAGFKLLSKGRSNQGLTRLHLALMPCLENNPVLAAYGAVRSGSAKALGVADVVVVVVEEEEEAKEEEEEGEVEEAEVEEQEAKQEEDSESRQAGGGGGAVSSSGEAGAAGAAAVADVTAADESPADAADATAAASGGGPGVGPDAPTQAPPQQQMSAADGPAAPDSSFGPPPAGASSAEPAQRRPERDPSRLLAGLRRRGLDEAAGRIERYQRSLRRPNRYGYRPIAQEWDIWVSPHAPADLGAAGISHGSAGQLVTQAVTTAMPCTRTCARSAGQALIRSQGTSPVAWLNAFGHAVNTAVQGSRDAPLPLAAPPARFWRLRAALHAVRGLPAAAWDAPYLRASLESTCVTLPDVKTARGAAQGGSAFAWSGGGGGAAATRAGRSAGGDGGGTGQDGGSTGGPGGVGGAPLSFWPLPLGFGGGEELVLELRGDPAGIVADTQVGMAHLPLGQLAQRCPQLLRGEAVHLEVPLVRQSGRDAAAAAAAVPAAAAGAGEAGEAGMEAAGEAAPVAAADGGAAGRQEQQQEQQTQQQEEEQQQQQEEQEGPAAAAEDGPATPPAARCGCFSASRARAVVSGAAKRTLNVEVLPGLTRVHLADRGTGGVGTGGGSAAAPAVAPATHAAPPSAPRLVLTVRLEEADCLDAAVAAGVQRAAAQTCLAMLSEPGGLYLDVKSAYSTPHDLQLFVSMLRGLGITTKAVCSFQPKQLKIAPGVCNTVLFFHGLSGLENACDAGRVPPGQFVLFNGASFLSDLSPGGLQLPEDRAAELLGGCRQYPLDALVVRRYKGLVEQYGFAGGIYVQEPDTGASAAQALIALLRANEAYFPLGFAYGHLRDAAVSVLELSGRGFASQEVLEELASRGELSNKVIAKVGSGQHRGVSPNIAAQWAGRLVTSSKLLSRREQRALISLLAELPLGEGLLAVLDDLGGIPRIVLRFFQHYESTTPMTLLEAGWNANHQKAFLRLLRNRGALAALPPHRKVELARFFVGPQLRGYGLTYILMFTRLRLGLHKHAKEGLLCLLESCTGDEYARVLLALGGRGKVERKLRGRWRLSWHYTRRMADVEALHATSPLALAYEDRQLKYSALPGAAEAPAGGGGGGKAGGAAGDDVEQGRGAPFNHLHTRDKLPRERVRRQLRKLGCCLCTLNNCAWLNVLTLGLFTVVCLYPRAIGATFKGTCAMPAAVAFVLGLLVAVGLYIFLIFVAPDAVF